MLDRLKQILQDALNHDAVSYDEAEQITKYISDLEMNRGAPDKLVQASSKDHSSIVVHDIPASVLKMGYAFTSNHNHIINSISFIGKSNTAILLINRELGISFNKESLINAILEMVKENPEVLN